MNVGVVYSIAQENCDLFEYIIAILEKIVVIIVNIIVIVGGIIGLRHIEKLKEKRMNASFGYFVQLNVRLHALKSLLKEYKAEIMDRFIPEGKRTPFKVEKAGIIRSMIEDFSRRAKETQDFLMHAPEQVSCGEGWFEAYTKLLELLEDGINISNPLYHKWSDDFTAQKEQYYQEHFANLKRMLDYIKDQENDIESKLFKKSKNKA